MSALAMSVGVRGAVPASGWVVTQLVTQYSRRTCGGRREDRGDISLGTRRERAYDVADLRCEPVPGTPD